MKELPKVFHNKLNNKINNNENVFYSNSNIENTIDDNSSKENIKNSKNVIQKINEIFSSPNYVYKANVEITLKDKIITKRIIGRNKDFIITMDNELIRINDIINIKAQKK